MITAIVLAAGQSKRMGEPKMLLPWGKTTVLQHVIQNLKSTGLEEILVVTGGNRERVESLVHGLARSVFNPDYKRGEMISSLQVGLRKASGVAILVVLGDQPQVQKSSLRQVVEAFFQTDSSIVVPSYNMRRGHPWIISKKHWGEIMEMGLGDNLRDFLNRHADEIHYVDVDDPGVLQDLDTPADYLKSRP